MHDFPYFYPLWTFSILFPFIYLNSIIFLNFKIKFEKSFEKWKYNTENVILKVEWNERWIQKRFLSKE